MSPHAMVTVIAPLPLQRLGEAEARIDALGNPPVPEVKAALDRLDGEAGTHFVSLHAVPSPNGRRAFLALEFSADGSETVAIDRLCAAIGGPLATVFALATDWREGTALPAFLAAHRAGIDNGWFGSPGVAFAGTPGMTVGRIRDEDRLAKRITGLLEGQGGGLTALARLAAVRRSLEGNPDFAAMLAPASAAPVFAPPSTPLLVAQLVGDFLRRYLWVLAIPLIAWVIHGGIEGGRGEPGMAAGLGFLWGAAVALLGGLGTGLLLLVIVAVLLLARLRAQEGRDWLDERQPERARLAGMFQRENHAAQNHMLSVTERKPGALRWFTARLVFWLIGELAARSYRPGYLSDIGTIHFARWVTAPGGRELLFFSNYGGSWESYLEDFIRRAHAGLTAVWSNCVGFPRTENLIQKGATDGERFKRYARHSMIPSRFWYSAYPGLTTATIRANAAIRRGLSGALTEDEAAAWLALFGSAPRPEAKLASNEIQSLVFGGLGFLKYSCCLLLDLPEDQGAARRWLAEARPLIAFNDGRRLLHRQRQSHATLTLALAPRGLSRLGLPREGLDGFPFAFLDGMTTEARARMLGDTGHNAAEHWRWGRETPDVALLCYGETAEDLASLEQEVARLAQAHGLTGRHRVGLAPITPNKQEPFGFEDGVSQPVIRGTYKGLRAADPIHIVEPGEFVLGYPDNSGNLPPGPTLAATADPENHLPLVEAAANDFSRTMVETPRDLGRNGSFLVIRELEQDVDGFRAYCRAEAERLHERLPEPYDITERFIGARLVGRWQDGSSLVRHPYQSRAEERDRSATARPKTVPAEAAPVDPPPKQSRAGDNDFLFGTEDPEALRCPFGAHIRRANPRDSMDPGSADQIAISNRHRILRVGRLYEAASGQRPGLFFMCLNGDIERQFEFVQQTWLRSPSFHGLSCEKDPLMGDGEAGACGFTIPSREGPLRLSSMPPFVFTRGGGYFFLPGKRLIDYLSAPG